MKLRPRDVISYEGRDYVVEGVLTYKLGVKAYPLARAVDGADVIWVEPLMGDLDDRLLVFKEVRDLSLSTPPPPTISHKGNSYVARFSGAATVAIEGVVADRTAGACDVWRYRAAGSWCPRSRCSPSAERSPRRMRTEDRSLTRPLR